MNEHSEVAGMGRMVLTCVLQQLTEMGQQKLATALQQQPLPPHWEILPQPRLSTSDSSKLMMGIEDIKRTLQLLPFVLTPTFLKLPAPSESKANPHRHHLTAVFTADALLKWGEHEDGANCLGHLASAAADSQRHVFAKTREAGSPATDELGTHDYKHEIQHTSPCARAAMVLACVILISHFLLW
jgi:hypothetical protein